MWSSYLLLLALYTPLFARRNGKAPPNIIFMLLDDMGWNDLAFHGGSGFPSPNIDRLASNGLELNNYYVQHICTPTRAALQTGRYPIHLGLQNGIIHETDPYGLPLDQTLISQELKRAGYNNHLIGKWHLGFFTPDYVPTSRGYDTFLGFYGGEQDYYMHNRTYDGVWGFDMRNCTQPVLKPDHYSTWLFGNETIRLLKQYDDHNKAKPFFLHLSFQSIHKPLQAPEYIINRFEDTIISSDNRRSIAAMVTVADQVIGDIVQFLKHESKSNLWDNLLFIFTTDNGGPTTADASNFPLRGSKGTLWEGGVKGVSFITGGWLPDSRRGKQMNALMHVSDWYATILDIVGIEPSTQYSLDGYSQLYNIIHGVDDIYSPRDEILHNINTNDCYDEICGGIRWREYKLVVGDEVDETDRDYCETGWCPLNDTNLNDTTIQCRSDGGNYNYPDIQQLIDTNACPYNGEPCLYDIINDPCEYYDIRKDNIDVYNHLYERLLHHNLTAAIPLNYLCGSNASAADPQKLGGFWGPWVNNSNFTSDQRCDFTANASDDSDDSDSEQSFIFGVMKSAYGYLL